LKINYLRKSAGKVQEDQAASAKFFPQSFFDEEFFKTKWTGRERSRSGEMGANCPDDLGGTKVDGFHCSTRVGRNRLIVHRRECWQHEQAIGEEP
jgi:hypothetical protein